jgi:hypothetical protein
MTSDQTSELLLIRFRMDSREMLTLKKTSTSTYLVPQVHEKPPIAVGLSRAQNVNTPVQPQRRTGRERRTNCRYRMNTPTLVRSETAGFGY